MGPSGAARRLPGPKNLFFLKLALLIFELLLERPWGSRSVPEALLGSPKPPSLLQAPPGLRKPIETKPENPENTALPPESPKAALVLLKPSS